jgi:CBS domain-containing protein
MRSVEWDANTGGAVTCAIEQAAHVAIDRRADLSEMAARTPVREIVPPLTTCLGSELKAVQARAIALAKGLRALGVADGEGKLVGLVMAEGLATADDATPLSALVVTSSHTLLADAPIGHAIALMAVEDISAVPCVTSDGKLLGICEAAAVLRWVATQMGLVLPTR